MNQEKLQDLNRTWQDDREAQCHWRMEAEHPGHLNMMEWLLTGGKYGYKPTEEFMAYLERIAV